MISFGSDNHSGIHPKILEAIVEVNGGVLCSDVSHLNVDECGAPEKITGSRVISVPHSMGKISPLQIEEALIRQGDQHFSQIKMVSITQPTELGTSYSLQELREIRETCQRFNLYLHIDGARLTNAAITLNCEIKELCQGADLVSFGGTKNGLLAGEMVLIFNKKFHEGFKYYRKQNLQLPSKTRFFAASFLRFFKDDLWQDIARHSISMAQDLATQLQNRTSLLLKYPVQSNAVFCEIPKTWLKPLRKKYFFYVWDEKTFEVRLMTSFNTRKEYISSFIQEIQSLPANESPNCEVSL